jgi:hypothetical protein
MNALKRVLGLIWLILGPVSVFYLMKTGISEMAKKPIIETQVQWAVFIGVSVPIALGLMIFGFYALMGEYDNPNALT